MSSRQFPYPEKPLFLLTVDTEEEWDWHGAFPTGPWSTRNIEQLPKFQTLCSNSGVSPTYFVDHAVADEPSRAALIRDYLNRGECDVGAHLHPWCTPPLDASGTADIDESASHAVNLPLTLFENKIKVLTERLQDAFGCHPYSYRAGRWGVNGAHLGVLAKAGYRIDSSVRPFYSDSSFDYNTAFTRPYWPSFDNALDSDSEQRELLEVPTSSGFNRPQFERLNALHSRLSKPPFQSFRLVGLLWHLRLLRKITVTPEGQEAADICRCIDAGIKRGDRVVNMFFHSSDLLPGSTPYVRNGNDKRRFLDRLQRCIDHVRDKHGAHFVTMRSIRQHLTAGA